MKVYILLFILRHYLLDTSVVLYGLCSHLRFRIVTNDLTRDFYEQHSFRIYFTFVGCSEVLHFKAVLYDTYKKKAELHMLCEKNLI